MRTTVTFSESLWKEAIELTGIKKTGKLIDEALSALIARESSKRLAKLSGQAPDMNDIPRRKTEG